jgi:PEP-CTERM motif
MLKKTVLASRASIDLETCSQIARGIMVSVALALAFAPVSVSAAPVLQVVAPGSGVDTSTRWTAFSLADTWTNVVISLELGNSFATSGNPSANVFLTNSIGTSANEGLISAGGNEVAPAAHLSSPTNGFNDIFSGLTLGPGSYYIVFENTNGQLGWIGFPETFPDSVATVTEAAGVSYNGSQVLNSGVAWAPGNTSGAGFRANNFKVTGDLQLDPNPVPEPSTWALSLIGMLFLLGQRRRRALIAS